MIDLVVIGAGGFGRETLDVVDAVNKSLAPPGYRVLGVIDDSPSAANLERLTARGYRHIGSIHDWLLSGRTELYLIAIGNPQTRHKIATLLGRDHACPSVIHPAAVLGSQVRVGRGTIVCSGAQISTNVQLGDHVHINPGVLVGHDSRLATSVSVNPGAVLSGEVDVQERVLIGAGAVVLQQLTIGYSARIGAAACVVKNVAPMTTVRGVPAM